MVEMNDAVDDSDDDADYTKMDMVCISLSWRGREICLIKFSSYGINGFYYFNNS